MPVKRFRWVWVIGLFGALLVAGCGGQATPPTAAAEATPPPGPIAPASTPTVREMTTNQAQPVMPGEQIGLSLVVDAVGAPVEYEWIDVSGKGKVLYGQGGSDITYVAPIEPGTYPVKVAVKVGEWKTTRSLSIIVAAGASGSGGAAAAPPTPEPTSSSSASATGGTSAGTSGGAGATGAGSASAPTKPLTGDKVDVYVGPTLSSGFDMGVNTSGELTGWVENDGQGVMTLRYPPDQQWGAVFITVGAPQDRVEKRESKNFAGFSELQVDMRGENGGEVVSIGMKDTTDPNTGEEDKVEVTLTPEWQTYRFPLSEFRTADLARLYVVTEFVFELGTPAQTISFRNVRFVK